MVSIESAAKHFGRCRRTIERWIEAGCPHRRRGRRIELNLEAVEQWRAAGDPLQIVAAALHDVWRRDAGDGETAWQSLRLPEAEAITLLLLAWDRIAVAAGKSDEPLPPPLRHAMSRLIALRQKSTGGTHE